MPMEYMIDTGNELICTVWTGEATDNEFIDALVKYQDEVKSRAEYIHYSEILDLSGIESFNLSSDGLRRLSEIAAKLDKQSGRTKLAIIATQTIGYGLARMYQTYRSFIPSASKDVRIFRTNLDAMEWIGGSPGTAET